MFYCRDGQTWKPYSNIVRDIVVPVIFFDLGPDSGWSWLGPADDFCNYRECHLCWVDPSDHFCNVEGVTKLRD